MDFNGQGMGSILGNRERCEYCMLFKSKPAHFESEPAHFCFLKLIVKKIPFGFKKVDSFFLLSCDSVWKSDARS